MIIVREKRVSLYDRLYDPTLFIVTLIILLFSAIGLVALYSAANGNIHPWAFKQMIYVIVFFFIMLWIRILNIKIIYDLSYTSYFIFLMLLIVAEVAGYQTMGAQRWIKVGAISIQPSEFMKIGIILVLAKYFQDSFYLNHNKIRFLIIPCLILLVPVLFILKQPNIGTALIITVIAVSIYFTSGINKLFFIIPGITLLLTAPFIWSFLHDYQKRRILTFLNPEDDLLGAGYNIAQSKIAIGSGGFAGKGLLYGTQSQLSFLPEKHTDFILTLIAEEWGFIGYIVIVLLYIALLIICYRAAFNSFNHFGRMIAIGVATMIFIHVSY